MPATREASINEVYELFKHSGVNLEVFKSAALNDNPEVLFAAIKHSLDLVDKHIKGLTSKTPEKTDEIFASMCNVLNSLADVSPSFKAKMEQEGIYGLRAHNFLENAAKMERLKKFMAHALQNDNLNQMHLEFARAVRNYHAAQANEIQGYANNLRPHAGPHHESAAKALANTSAEVIGNKASSGKFDPLKAMGIVLSDLLHLYVVADVANKYWPDVKFEEKPMDPKDDPQRKLWQAQTGTERPVLRG